MIYLFLLICKCLETEPHLFSLFQVCLKMIDTVSAVLWDSQTIRWRQGRIWKCTSRGMIYMQFEEKTPYFLAFLRLLCVVLVISNFMWKWLRNIDNLHRLILWHVDLKPGYKNYFWNGSIKLNFKQRIRISKTWSQENGKYLGPAMFVIFSC
jgi:hypothetical protein